MKVFIGGSRKVTRVNTEMRKHLDAMIRKRHTVCIGDANGADKAVQQYLSRCEYRNVEVFCVNGKCRNNIGSWKVRSVPAPEGISGFEYYTLKDKEMADEASSGFMIWDGKSRGTLRNIHHLVGKGKEVMVYVVPAKETITLRNPDALGRFLSRYGVSLSRDSSRLMGHAEKQRSSEVEQLSLI